jgi:cytochrome P450
MVTISMDLDLNTHLRSFRAILHDPKIFPYPEEFQPERFLNKDGSFRDDPMIALAFGSGKRICPGRHLVDATLFIVASSIASVFSVTKAKDEQGKEIPVKAVMTAQGGIVMYVSGYLSFADLRADNQILKPP